MCSELSFFAFVWFLPFLELRYLLMKNMALRKLGLQAALDAQSLVRRAFFLALGTMDLRFWYRPKLK